ncbi:MAG: sigma-54 dependent transcriptional regulator, partial [Duncaniella sp.]|nr:sigma-54 dependent transcriptional regulator [Duncaniella sp.]
MAHILIVDDDSSIILSLSMLLKRAGHTIVSAHSEAEAVKIVRDSLRGTPSDKISLALMDMNYTSSTSGRDGLELLQKIKILLPALPVILMTAWGSIPLAVEGVKLGAMDFITKPWDNRDLLSRIDTALSLNSESSPLSTNDNGAFDGIIGESENLKSILDKVRKAAPTDAAVLITGENGTGKELIARAIHRLSRRSNGPFVTVNLGGMPSTLFESEMFGYAKGAFTGATSDRIGRFEAADSGTIFLDEIGDLDTSCQVKILRVLQEHTFERLGESAPRRADIRVVCATNVDLPAAVAEGRFREDLFYRINLITINLP